MKIVIIGGGIAGISCVEHLLEQHPPTEEKLQLTLISASPILKTAGRIQRITRNLEDFGIEQQTIEEYLTEKAQQADATNCSLAILHDVVTHVDPSIKVLVTEEGKKVPYDKLCICTGGSPKMISTHPEVLGIRDIESVQEFSQRLQGARKFVIVGNGGIALELIQEVRGTKIVWVIKDDHVGSTFLDPGASHFLLGHLEKRHEQSGPTAADPPEDDSPGNRPTEVSHRSPKRRKLEGGPSTGPNWGSWFSENKARLAGNNVEVNFESEVMSIAPWPGAGSPKEGAMERDWALRVTLANGDYIDCDFVVSATGVAPNTSFCGPAFEKDDLGGLQVTQFMETSVADVFAAGDACSANWAQAPHWFQMRLWNQARTSGRRAAASMLTPKAGWISDFSFEIFTHVTRFLGFKVVLLGLFNAQKLAEGWHVLLRCDPAKEYVKVVVKEGRVQGAVLIGETDLEETMENLILNGLDISSFEGSLLDPDFEVEDFFD